MPRLLNDDEIDAALGGLPGWEREGDALVRTAALPSFPAAITVVDRVAAIAEERDHHPDIDIRYHNVKLALTTHSEDGLTSRDFDVANEIEQSISAD